MSDHETSRYDAATGLAQEAPPEVLPDPPLQPSRHGEPPQIDVPEPPDPQQPWNDPAPPEPPTPRPPELPPEASPPEPGT